MIDHAALAEEYGLETTVWMNPDGNYQDSIRDNAGWFSTCLLRPRPLPPTNDRAANESYAERFGFYWMLCDRCGEFRGGHEAERNRICERWYRDNVLQRLQLYDKPIEVAAHTIVSANHYLRRLREMASPTHFQRRPFRLPACSCGSIAEHESRLNNIMANAVFEV